MLGVRDTSHVVIGSLHVIYQVFLGLGMAVLLGTKTKTKQAFFNESSPDHPLPREALGSSFYFTLLY